MLIFITAVSVVLVVSFLCSIFESVLLSLTRPQIEVMVGERRRAGALLAGFKDNMDVPIAAILILNTAAHTIGAAVAGASYSSAFTSETLWIFSILFTLAVLLFTEIIPKTLGVSYSQALATPVAHGIDWLSRLLLPLVWVSERISRSLRRDVPLPVTSTKEIRLLAILGRSEGAVGVRTAGMIVGATQVGELHADDVMLPREKVHWLSATMNRDAVMGYLADSSHSRFPFSPTDEMSDITGVVLVKDLLYWLLVNEDQEIDWEAIRQDVLVVPESVGLVQLLRTFQDSHRHLAVVVDEYGDIGGIVTLEDVIEEIVGDIRDESDKPDDDLKVLDDNSLLVRGSVDLRRISARLNIPWQAHTDITTISGLVTEQLERIPLAGDAIDWNGYRVEVLRADARRARLLSLRKNSADA